MTSRTNTALVAAHQASDALAELLRFCQEGNAIDGHPFGDADPVEKLAEALALTGEIAMRSMVDARDAEYREAIGQVVHAARNFIVDWAG